MGRLLDIAASVVSVGAGLYLLSRGSASVSGIAGGESWFEVIAHGMGAYFVAKGIWMARSLHLQAEAAETNRKMLELDAHEHTAATMPSAASES